jgi:hypothetical protein
MVNLLVGHKGSGKTAKMIDMANASLNEVSGSVVFINKNHRLMYDLKYRIRVVCMEDFEQVTNVDEYIGFLYGIISQDHDIERLFIDSILKHADVHLEDLPDFLERVNEIYVKYGIDFYISLSAAREELGDIVNKYKVLN